MAIGQRLTDDLIRIAAAGGGLTINVQGKMTDDLVRIAAAGSRSGARLVFHGPGGKLVDDLVRIAAAGGGCVSFSDF